MRRRASPSAEAFRVTPERRGRHVSAKDIHSSYVSYGRCKTPLVAPATQRSTANEGESARANEIPGSSPTSNWIIKFFFHASRPPHPSHTRPECGPVPHTLCAQCARRTRPQGVRDQMRTCTGRQTRCRWCLFAIPFVENPSRGVPNRA